MDTISEADALDMLTAWEAMASQPETISVVVKLLEALSPEVREAWWKGKRQRFKQLMASTIDGGPVSRGNAYELTKTWAVAGLLEEAGEMSIDAGWRDKVNNRRVKTIVRELARLRGLATDDEILELYRFTVRGDNEGGGPWAVDGVKMLVRTIKTGDYNEE